MDELCARARVCSRGCLSVSGVKWRVNRPTGHIETHIKCFTVCCSAHTPWRDGGGCKSTTTPAPCNYAGLISTPRCLIRLVISTGCDSHQVWWWTPIPPSYLSCKHTDAAPTVLERFNCEEADICFWFYDCVSNIRGISGIHLREVTKCEKLAEGPVSFRFNHFKVLQHLLPN